MSEHVEPPFDRPDKDFNTLDGWTWVGTYGGYYLQCDQLSAFEHGFLRGCGMAVNPMAWWAM